MVLNLEDMGYEIESSHHETAPAQHEIDFKFAGANEMADCVMTFKMQFEHHCKTTWSSCDLYAKAKSRGKWFRYAHSFCII